MIPEEKKYERLINILRKSKPVLESTDDIEGEGYGEDPSDATKR